MERRSQILERRKPKDLPLAEERRAKVRRRTGKFSGSPPAADATIDMSIDDVARYWAKELGVSADELKAAVQKTGSSVKAVRDYFGK